jgi:hypothetical protein
VLDEVQAPPCNDAAADEIVPPTLIGALGDARDDLDSDTAFFRLVRKNDDRADATCLCIASGRDRYRR